MSNEYGWLLLCFCPDFFADFCWKDIVLFLMLKSEFQIFWGDLEGGARKYKEKQ